MTIAPYDHALCNERHTTIDRRLSEGKVQVEKVDCRVDELVSAINGKFSKLFYFFITTLVTSLGGTLVILIALALKGGK